MPKAIIGRIFHSIERLKDDPFPRQAIKLAGAEQLYRLRMGDYRSPPSSQPSCFFR